MKYILPLVFTALLASSCTDLLDEKPSHFGTADQVYTTADGFQAGLNGIYGLMRSEREGETYTESMSAWQYELGMIYYVGLDDITSGGNKSGGPAQLITDGSKYNIYTNTFLEKVFTWLYSTINAANTIIERAENPDVNWNLGGVNQKARILGEAHCARAWAYRLLIAGWGDVPIKLDESKGNNIHTDFVRASEKEVREQMVKDLLIAAEGIPWRPYAAGSMTKGVALHYLAETYMALGDPEEAERYLNILIGDGAVSAGDALKFGTTDRSLMRDFNGMFDPSKVDYDVNTETLWTWQFALNTVGGGNNMRRHTLVTYYPSNRTVDSATLKLNFNNSTIGICPTYDRGSYGWGQAYINPRVLKLYYRSSPSSAEDFPAAAGKAENRGYWTNFVYESRGNDKAIRKYFTFDTSTDAIDWAKAGKNTMTGEVWKTGDRVWFTSSKADASLIEQAMGMDYRLASGNRTNYPYVAKFATCDKGYEIQTESHQNQMYLRLGESYLLRAEARVRQGNLGGAAADINTLRGRSGANQIEAQDLGAVLQDQLDFILDERSRELLGEEQRRVTLTRMGRKDFLYRRVKMYNAQDADNFRKEDIYWAIPRSVINTNISVPMPNNPGFTGGPAVDATGWPNPVVWNVNDPDVNMK